MRAADGSTPRVVAAAVGLILLAGAAVYSNSLSGEFVFDDLNSVVGNASIRSFSTAFESPPNTTTSGRPLLNLTLALNYALGEYEVRGYHLFNVLLHLSAAVVLFALVRGTLLRPVVPDRFRDSATGIGFAVALLWAVHPLQTEVVSYVVQRGEALAALFTLLALLGLLLSAGEAERAARWSVPAARKPAFVRRRNAAAERASMFASGAVVAGALGVLSKETAAALPVIALLYDRAFLSGSFREAFRRRGATYAGLFASWVLLAWLVSSSAGRGGTAGGASPFEYAVAQSMWVLHYVRLSAFPEPLVFDYGFAVAPWGPPTQLATAVVLVLLALTVAACVWRPAVGFLPVAFFAALAPSSSFVAISTQVAAERRMYLALAAVLAVAALAVVRVTAALPFAQTTRTRIQFAILLACAVPLIVQTHLRNRDYRNGLSLWADTVSKVPDNPRARTNLGRALLESGRTDEAVAQLRAAVALAPDDPRPHNMLGFALLQQGKTNDAVASFREVARLDPDSPDARQNLALALHASGQLKEAVVWYEKTLVLQPENAAAHFNLGRALNTAGRKQEAAACFRTAARLDPAYARWLTTPPQP